MKKSLIALAMFGAFSSAALAQSNVTLYGVVDVGFRYDDPDCTSTATVNCGSVRNVHSGHFSGSRLGFRGTEVLTPGLNAVFTIEAGFNTDTGTSGQGGRLLGRQVWGGFSGGWGTVVAGRLATFSSGTGSFDMIGNADPFVTGFGDSGLQNTITPMNSTRLDNSVLYQSPVFGGFRFGAGYSFNANGGEVGGTGNNNRYQFYGVNFARGPFFVAVTYDIIDVVDGGVAGSAASPAIFPNAADQKMLAIGATFDLKFLKIHGAYAKEDHVVFTHDGGQLQVNSTAGADADAWMAGLTVPLGAAGSLFGSYQRRDQDSVGVCLGVFVPATGGCSVALQTRDGDIRVWAIGYVYPFSRRTNLYASFSDKDGKGFFNNSVTLDRRQYTVGIRHLF